MLSIERNPDPLKFRIEPSHIFIYLLFIPLLLTYHVAYGYDLPEIFKSIFYFLPLYGLATLFVYNIFTFDRNLKLNFSYVQLAIAYLVLVVIGLYLNAQDIYQSTFYRDIVIIVLPLLFFAFEWKFTEKQFNWLFVAAVLSFTLWKQFKFSFNILNTILVTIQSDSEYHFGCVAGLFFIFYLYKKKWFWLVLSVVFISLVSKRSNLLGLGAAIPVYYLIVNPLKIYEKKIGLFVFLFAYYMLFWILGTNMEFFGSLFLKSIGSENISIDRFLTGRMILINQLQPEILERGFMSFLFGNGPGQAEVFLWKTIRHSTIYLWEAKPYLVHNDFLKLQFEIGLIGAVLYFFILYYLYACSRLGVFIFLYAVPLFLIDNTVIYLYNILVGCVAARVIDTSEKHEHNLFSSSVRIFR